MYVVCALGVIFLGVVFYLESGLAGVAIIVGIAVASFGFVWLTMPLRIKGEERQRRRMFEKLDRKARKRREKLEQQASRER